MKRSDLYAAVWEKPLSLVARDLGLSDTWLRVVCKRNGVPVPARGYWQRRPAEQEILRQPLPEAPEGEIEIRLVRSQSEVPQPELWEAMDAGQLSTEPSAPASDCADLWLEVALIEMEAAAVMRHQVIEDLIVKVGATLALTPGLDVGAWCDWLQRLRREASRSSRPTFLVQLALNRFKERDEEG